VLTMDRPPQVSRSLLKGPGLPFLAPARKRERASYTDEDMLSGILRSHNKMMRLDGFISSELVHSCCGCIAISASGLRASTG